MVAVSYLVHYDTLLQNVIDIITKCDKDLLQNLPGFLLQNATVITKCIGATSVYSSCQWHLATKKHLASLKTEPVITKVAMKFLNHLSQIIWRSLLMLQQKYNPFLAFQTLFGDLSKGNLPKTFGKFIDIPEWHIVTVW